MVSQPDGAAAFAPETPAPARIYDYLLHGKDNYPADREAAKRAVAAIPDLPVLAQANRRFLTRTVQAAASAGITQFLDLGSGLPTTPNVHETAQEIQPEARVVYVDNDRRLPGCAHGSLSRSRARASARVGGHGRE